MSLQFQWKLSPVNCQWQKRLQSSSNAVQCQKMAESRRPGNPGGFLLFWPDRYEATVVLCPWVLRVHVLMYSFQYEYRLRKQDLTVLLTFGVHTHTYTKYTAGNTDKEQRLYWHPNIYSNHTNMNSMNHPILFSWSGLKSSGINTCILWSLWSLVLGLESIQLLVPGSANPAGRRYSDLLFH